MPQFIDSEIEFFGPEAGGRTHELVGPVGVYSPHLRVGSDGEMLGVRLYDGPDVVRFGELVTATWELLYSGVQYGALTPGAEFTILEGPNPVGKGVVMGRRAPQPSYGLVFGSDTTTRDGLFLELDRLLEGKRETLLEVFRSDTDGTWTFSSYMPVEIPLEQVEAFIEEARNRFNRDSGQ